MRKKIYAVIAIVLIATLCLPLAGCGNSTGSGDSAPPNSSAPPAGGGESSSPPAAGGGESSSPPAASASPPSGGGAAEPQGGDDGSGDLFGPDDQITMAYLSYSMDIGWCVQVADAFNELANEYNLQVYIADGGFNPETQFNQLEQYIAMGVDVLAIMCIDPGSAQAFADRCKEVGILLLGETTSMRDVNDQLVAPCDWLYGYEVGYKMAEWTVNNYERFGFDLSDLSKVGYIYMTDSMFVEMAAREQGSEEVWLKAFPDFPRDQMFCSDRSSDLQASNMEAGYNTTAAIITANPQFETWIILSYQEDYASGACRAIEDLGLVERTMLVSAGGENVIPEWDAGLTKPWYASCYFTGMDSASIIADAIEKILRQGVSLEDVYPKKEPGGTYGYETFSGVMIEYGNYKSIIR